MVKPNSEGGGERVTLYQKRMAEDAEKRRQEWREKKDQVRQWLVDNEAPKEILDLFDTVALTPTYSWV